MFAAILNASEEDLWEYEAAIAVAKHRIRETQRKAIRKTLEVGDKVQFDSRRKWKGVVQGEIINVGYKYAKVREFADGNSAFRTVWSNVQLADLELL